MTTLLKNTLIRYEELIPSVIEYQGKRIQVIYEKTDQLQTDMEIILQSSNLPFYLKNIGLVDSLSSFFDQIVSEDGIATFAIGRGIFSHDQFRKELGETTLRTSTALHGLFPFPILREDKQSGRGDYFCYFLFANIHGIQREGWFNLSEYFRGGVFLGDIGVVCLKQSQVMKVTQHEVVIVGSH